MSKTNVATKETATTKKGEVGMMLKEYRKRAYEITAEMVPAGTELYNFLEDAHYTTSEEECIKLTGTVGETWPVTLKKLCKTYEFTDGTPITASNIPSGAFAVRTIVGEDSETIFAEQTREQLQITTNWGAVLTANRDGVPHGDGDYIVCSSANGNPNLQDQWIVNGEIFLKTYEEVTRK